MRALSVWLLAAFLFLVPGRAENTGGQVAGVVRSAATGEALKSAIVILRSQHETGNFSRATATGPGGDFVFGALPAGRYGLVIRKTGYRTFHGARSSVRLGEDQQIDNLRFSLPPNAAISGTVRDWESEPVAGAEVRAYSLHYGADDVSLELAALEQTDDRGAYRLSELPAGKYFVHVSPPRGRAPAALFYANTPAVFYPGVPSPVQALAVETTWGQQVSSIDVALDQIPAFTVGGVAVDAASGGPCSRCLVGVLQREGPFSLLLPQRAVVAPDGVFGISGLADGDYTLIGRQGRSYDRAGQTHVSVRGRHFADARLVTGIAHSVRGKLVLDDPPDGTDATAWVPRLAPLDAPRWWPGADGRIEDDLSFSTSEIPPAAYRLSVEGLPPGAYLKEVRIGTQRLPSAEVLVSGDGAELSLEVLVAFDAASLSGRVTGMGGEGEQAVQALIHLVSAAKNGGYARSQKTVTAVDGTFSFAAVVPGEYSLYALPEFPEIEVFDPAVEASLGPRGEAIMLEPGEAASASVSLLRFPE